MAFENIPIGEHAPEVVNVIVEIPKGSHHKYEFDEKLGIIKLDRVLHSPVFYPADYGFIPETRSPDGDHLDILVIINDPVFPGCLVRARVLGVLYMEDENGKDEKIISAAENDPRLSSLKSIEDVDEFYRKEIHHFFEVYKQLEKKMVKVHHWHGKENAVGIINEAIKRFRSS